jgi:hypothetical protein
MSRIFSVSPSARFEAILLNLGTEEERFPYLEGWRPPTAEANLMTLAAMVVRLQQASGEALSEGLLITTNTLQQAFGGYDPITGLLAHVK